jgi:hypothetical protein
MPPWMRQRKLTPQQAQFIIDALAVSKRLAKAQGLTRRHRGIYNRLAEKFGVSRWAILDIARRNTWKGFRAETKTIAPILRFAEKNGRRDA